MNDRKHITWSNPRSIDPTVLSDIRDELYRAAALCEALHHAMDGARISNGFTELLLTVENVIDGAAERVHVLTFPEGRAAA
ncbi:MULTISPECIES: hypothetical protein [unclassified Mesorhizobium]|uniref:hypothetical protein n=1 Tax=unclassified Mesorhizobium TaxID=325217 RepID=UPI00301532FB